ncbi:MerR family transcriptional regulator [Microbacterium soli]|uniref:HTH merR-type domain-containing protein n=1 Tax=Microbacterium soli TaxID=446075 RepID=A0ABP7NC72_9MICO
MEWQESPDDPRADAGTWKVGRLAELTGITVRTLRHYDQIGLLQPSATTSGQHRVYDRDNVTRLYRILALRGLGFGLADIKSLLDDPQWDLRAMVSRHLADTERTAEVVTRLATRLRALDGELDRSSETPPEELFTLIEEMTMLDTPVRRTTTLLVYEDLAAAHAYLSQTFGLLAGPLERDSDGRAVHAELYAGDQAIWLHPVGEGYRSPRELGAVSGMTVILVNSVDDHYRLAIEHNADIVEAPVDQPYGVREYGARDLEGHLWYFHSPLP